MDRAVSYNTSEIGEAKRRLDTLFFVGILEEWELSMCLLNYKLVGKRFVEPCQLVNTRPTDTSQGSPTATLYDVNGYPKDISDEQIYQHGRKRFQQELSRHGISKQSCKFTFDGGVRE